MVSECLPALENQELPRAAPATKASERSVLAILMSSPFAQPIDWGLSLGDGGFESSIFGSNLSAFGYQVCSNSAEQNAMKSSDGFVKGSSLHAAGNITKKSGHYEEQKV